MRTAAMPYRHYVTGKFTSRAQRLDDAAYSSVLDSMVVACVDCLLTNDGRVLLGQRTREPQADWWVIGGRMLPGESFEQAATRHCRRELGLVIAPKRFAFLDVASLVFARRAQPPQGNGCHTVTVTITAELTTKEAAAVKPNDEYRAVAWRPMVDGAGDAALHPWLRQVAADLMARGNVAL